MKILKDLNVRSLGDNIDVSKYLGLQLSDRLFPSMYKALASIPSI